MRDNDIQLAVIDMAGTDEASDKFREQIRGQLLGPKLGTVALGDGSAAVAVLDAGEQPVAGVAVELFHDADGMALLAPRNQPDSAQQNLAQALEAYRLAVEQWRGSAEVDHLTDIWAVGSVGTASGPGRRSAASDESARARCTSEGSGRRV